MPEGLSCCAAEPRAAVGAERQPGAVGCEWGPNAKAGVGGRSVWRGAGEDRDTNGSALVCVSRYHAGDTGWGRGKGSG